MTGVLACKLDTSGVGEGSGDEIGSSTGATSLSTSTGASTGASTTATSNASTESTTTVGTTIPSDDGPAETSFADSSSTGHATSDEGSSAGESSSSSTGAVPDESYPPCMVDTDCAAPYSLCWPPEKFGTPAFCTMPCTGPGDCPVPSSGSATPVCEGGDQLQICVLDCTSGDCPDGMSCIDVFSDGNYLRCNRD